MKERSDEWYSNRITELEEENGKRTIEAQYYQSELAKAHELLGRVMHQFSEHWDMVRLTRCFPTDNPSSKRNIDNPRGV